MPKKKKKYYLTIRFLILRAIAQLVGTTTQEMKSHVHDAANLNRTDHGVDSAKRTVNLKTVQVSAPEK